MKILRIIKSLFRAAAPINTLTTTTKEPELETLQAKVMETNFFIRKNNLVEEFAYIPTPVYSANFENPQIIGWLQADGSIINNQPLLGSLIKEEYKGYMLMADTISEMKMQKLYVDYGDTDGLLTIEKYHEEQKFKEATHEELLADDVDLLENKMLPPAQPNTTVPYTDGVDNTIKQTTGCFGK